MPVNAKAPSNEPIGIDLGIEKLAVTSNNDVFENINKTKEVRRLKKKKRRLQRKISRKYEQNKGGEGRYRKTNNIIKSEILLKKLYKRLTNIRNNHLHQTTSSITKREPSFIVLEDLCVSGMMKNRHLAKAIQEQKFYEFRRQIKYKSYWNGIEVIIAPRFLPSSKTCSNCGSYKKDLKLQHRTFVCDECGFKEDRDLNASLNLLHYGQSVR
jgi:putative transposase